ncbi:MAG: thiamine diphosphokinase [Lachnospiraceae bacterium]|nr:thiamine diphosphokinase [Lachnospiraceae bacterium]
MKTIIVAGGEADIEQLKSELELGLHDLLIAADSGADYIIGAGFMPDIIMGDLDSMSADRASLTSQIIEYPAEKDFTDLEATFNHAVSLGADDIIIYGATGRRLDHFFGNISLLIKADELLIDCAMFDRYNRIRLISSEITLIKEKTFGKYISIIPIDDNVNITLTGFKYPLDNYHLKRDNALGVSNELSADKAKITVHSGRVLLIESI